MLNFNGQINISRDLRQNKQTVIGKRDLTDIIFLVLGVGISCLTGYLFGYYLKAIDEFATIFVAIIPLVIVMLLGFRKKAGMRYFYYVMMTLISKCSKNRYNKSKFFNVIDKEKLVVNQRSKNILDKVILILSVNKEDIKETLKKYLNNEIVYRIQLRIKGNQILMLLELNYSYKDFFKVYTNNEYKSVREKKEKKESIKSFIKRQREKLYYQLFKKRKHNNKGCKSINLSLLNRDFMPKEFKDLYDSLLDNGLFFIEKDENVKNIKDKKVFGLHLYNNSDYEAIVSEISLNNEIVIYVIKHNKKIYLSTFFILDKDSEINTNKNIVINTLKNEQEIALLQCTYNMFNPYNNFRYYER